MFTKEDLKKQLMQMGIKPSDHVLIHTSFKAVGQVEGGPEAFIDAFCEYLTDGMFIVPTHTWSNVSRNQPVYDVRTSVPCIGLIPRTAAFRPDGIRSLHPTHSVAAWGPRAAEFIAGEENATSPCTPGGCWDRLREEDAKILLLGVTHNRNTFLHSVDEALGIPDRLTPDRVLLHTVMPDGTLHDTWMHRHFNSTYGSGAYAEYYNKLKQAFYDLGAAKPTRFGDAECILCEARKLYGVCKKLYAIEENCVIDRETIPESWWK